MNEPLPALLFCTSYMDSQDAWKRRYARWVDYYEKIPLARSATFLIDDASPYLPEDPRLAVGGDLPAALGPFPVHMHRFANHLGRGSAERNAVSQRYCPALRQSVKPPR